MSATGGVVVGHGGSVVVVVVVVLVVEPGSVVVVVVVVVVPGRVVVVVVGGAHPVGMIGTLVVVVVVDAVVVLVVLVVTVLVVVVVVVMLVVDGGADVSVVLGTAPLEALAGAKPPAIVSANTAATIGAMVTAAGSRPNRCMVIGVDTAIQPTMLPTIEQPPSGTFERRRRMLMRGIVAEMGWVACSGNVLPACPYRPILAET